MDKIILNIEHTNNEEIIKFTSDMLATKGSHQFNNIDETANSPLAQQLFHLPFVKQIYISGNFIAIKRFSIVKWPDVEEEVKTQLENYLNSGGVLINDDSSKKRTMVPVEVYAESTPNPSVLKFVLNINLIDIDLEYKNSSEAKDSMLATELFKFPFVKELFISQNYVSITKHDHIEWAEVTNDIRTFIKTFIAEGKPVVEITASTKKASKKSANTHVSTDPISKQIVAILDEYIRPAVAADGGNIMFQSYEKESKTVHVILQGACSGCPSSTITLKNGIENMLKQLIPGEIEEVVALNH